MELGTGRQLDWSMPRRCLLLGVAGTGMRMLARILVQAGHVVYGADSILDLQVDTTVSSSPGSAPTKQSVAVSLPPAVKLLPWLDSTLPPDVDVCISSQAVPATAPLYRSAIEHGIAVVSLHAAIASVFADRQQICVAGTHGKSTTSSLLAWILGDAKNLGGAFVGAETVAEFSGIAVPAAIDAHSRLAVVEACEFNQSFLQLMPQHVLLTGIDGDHFDCFEDPQAEDAAYESFLKLVPADGSIMLNAACSRSLGVLRHCGRPAIRWCMDEVAPADWSGAIVDAEAGQMTVRIRHRGRHFSDLRVPLYGHHNAANLLGVVAMASHLGVTALQCQTALRTYPGLKRRLELRGIYGGMRMVDDYAHHPTAVTTTLRTVRDLYPEARVRVVFEPHQVLRLRRCWDRFVQALALADEVIVIPVFPAREQVSVADCDRISRQFAATISDLGASVEFASGVKSAVSIIELTGQPGDVVLTMGAGTVHRIHDEVHRRFQRDSAA